jgi:hypothetical protein
MIGTVTTLPGPPPGDQSGDQSGDRSIAERIRELDAMLGRDRFVEVCVDLLEGADRRSYRTELRHLSGHGWAEGDAVLDAAVWKDYWLRTWGARGLLYCWDDVASSAVVAGLADEHYRPAEMCLKVAARHDVAGAGPGAALLAGHELDRVRRAALRALAVVGDTEHLAAVESCLHDSDPAVREVAARTYERMCRRLDLA